MKKGLLLYNENDAKINKWFIERLIEVAKQNGIQLTFSVYSEDLLKDNSRLEGLDFCIFVHLRIWNKQLAEEKIVLKTMQNGFL